MDIKKATFFTIIIIFLPLIILSYEIGFYLLIVLLILITLSILNIKEFFKKSDTTIDLQIEKMLEEKVPLNINKLEMGFKVAKTILFASFFLPLIIVYDLSIQKLSLIIFSIFFSIVEYKIANRKKNYLSLFFNIFYLISLIYLYFS